MKWISAIILFAIIGVTKAHHIKLILLALLGLAGLYWMQNNRPSGPKQLFDIATKLLTKRDIHQQTSDIDWELVITNDPSTCARSYVCQLAATRADDSMLDRIKYSQGTNWALKEIQKALALGDYHDQKLCKNNYKHCPYSMKQMQQLMQLFNNK